LLNLKLLILNRHSVGSRGWQLSILYRQGWEKETLYGFKIISQSALEKCQLLMNKCCSNTLRSEDPDLLLSVGLAGTFAAIFAATTLLLVVRIAGISASISASVPDRRS